MKKLETKDSAVDLTDLAVGIVILGIVVTIGVTIMATVRDSHLTELSVYRTTNETLTSVQNTTASDFAKGWVKSLVTVNNATGGEQLTASNYTFAINSLGGGTLKLNTHTYTGSNLNVTYDSYNTSSRTDYLVSNQAVTGIGEYSNWFKIIVIVGVAAVVLALIFTAFGNRNSTNQGIGGTY